MSANGFKFAFLKSLHGAGIPTGARVVLVAILDYADADGENAHPGEQTLAHDCDMCVRTVRRHIRWLIEHGWLVEVFRGRRGKDGRGWASEYAVRYGDTATAQERDATAAETPVELDDPAPEYITPEAPEHAPELTTAPGGHVETQAPDPPCSRCGQPVLRKHVVSSMPGAVQHKDCNDPYFEHRENSCDTAGEENYAAA